MVVWCRVRAHVDVYSIMEGSAVKVSLWQVPEEDDDSYEKDSFCVGSQEQRDSSKQDSLY